MSKKLAKLLSVDATGLALVISKLEEKTGFPSEDVRLLAQNKHQVRRKIEQLGLDANDTTDKELYYALRARYVRDSQMLDKALGVNQHTNLDNRLNKVIQLVNHCASVDDVWVIKNSLAKAALVKYPPRQVGRHLHYRSASSLIKREDTAEIYLAASLIESTTWRKNIAKYLAKLNASSYELRPVRIVHLKTDKWQNLTGPDSNVVIDKHTGAVALWPSDDLSRASVLCLTLFLLSGLRALNPNGYSEALHELSPALRWWGESENLISDGKQPVSLNIKDVSLNHLNEHDHRQAIRHHGSYSLWQTLTSRYEQVWRSLSDKVPDLQYNFNQSGLINLPTAAELSEEYARAE